MTEVCSYVSNSQYSSIGSDNGLAQTKRQAIVWINVGNFIDASLGLNELIDDPSNCRYNTS